MRLMNEPYVPLREYDELRDGAQAHLQYVKTIEADRIALDPPCSECHSVPCRCSLDRKAQRREEEIAELVADGYTKTADGKMTILTNKKGSIWRFY